MTFGDAFAFGVATGFGDVVRFAAGFGGGEGFALDGVLRVATGERDRGGMDGN